MDSSYATSSSASPTAKLPRFVGRRPQLVWLDRALREALAGHPRLLLIQGDAGIGKTRLVRELRALAGARGINLCYGRGYEDLTLPYLPLAESLLAWLVSDEGRGLVGADADIIAPLLRGGADTGSSPSVQSDQDKLRVFLAVSRATIRLARSRPTLLVIDDLHWADRSSLELLTHLLFAIADARLRGPVPLMVIGSYRPLGSDEALARVLARLQREDICHTLQLRGLDEIEIDEFVEGLGLARPTHELVTLLYKTTQGNPLFLQEVVRHLVERGAVRKRRGHLVADVSSAADLHLPEEITDALAARVEGLGESCRRVLTLASFLGDRLWLPALSVVSELPESELLDLLDEAVRRQLLVREGGALQFGHPLIRHVMYAMPSPARRQRIHHQIAQTLESLYADHSSDHVMEIAHHLIAAGPVAAAERVVPYARRGGDRALSIYAWGEAASFYEAALALADAINLPMSERAELHFWAGFAHYRDWDAGPAVDQYEKAIAAYRACGDHRGLALALRDKAEAAYTLASVSYGTLIDVQPLHEVLADLGEREPSLRGRVLVAIAHAYWTARRADQAEATAEEARRIAGQAGDETVCVEADVARALAQLQKLRVFDALESLRDALALARRIGDRWREGWALQRIPFALIALGRLNEAEEVALQACELGREVHDWGDYSVALAALAYVATAKGHFAESERHAAEALAMVHRSRYPWGGILALPTLSCARILGGDWAKAEAAIDLILQPGRIFDEVAGPVQIIAWVYQQLVRAHSGTLEEALRQQLTENSLRGIGSEGGDIAFLASLCAMVETGDLIGAPRMAEEVYDVLAQAVSHGVMFSSGWVFLIPRVLGVAAAMRGQVEAAERHFETAIEVATRADARPELARTCLDYARMLGSHAEGDTRRVRAGALLETAVVIFDELGMAPSLLRARQLAKAMEIALPARSPAAAALPRGQGGTAPAWSPSHFTEPAGTEATAAPVGTGPGDNGTVADNPLVILFTDMKGSTALIDRLGDRRAQPLLQLHDQIIRRYVDEQGGTEIQHTGDGLMVSFPSAARAISCAQAVQQAFARQNEEHPEIPLHVRIGINAGEPLAQEGRLFGAAVNAAARICARAKAGEILVSDVVRQLAAGKEVVFIDRGRARLKGFNQRFRLYGIRWQEEQVRGPTPQPNR